MRASRFLLAVLLVALPASSASAHPATNQPDVRQYASGAAHVFVLGKDKAVYQVQATFSVVNGEATNQYSYAIVSIAKCKKGKCGTPVQFLAPLTTGQYKAGDLKNVSMTFAALGKPIALTLTGAGPGDLDTSPQVQGYNVDTSSTWRATAKVTFMGVTCTDKSAVAARHSTFYPLGFSPPSGLVAMPAKPVAGTPAGAKSCRPGPS